RPAHLGVRPFAQIHAVHQATMSHFAPGSEQLRQAKTLLARGRSSIVARSNLLSLNRATSNPAWPWSSFTAPMLSQEEHRQRKRGRDQLAGDESYTPVSAKRQKRGHHNYPPEVWESLSKITLTRKALREFDRRTREHSVRRPPKPRRRRDEYCDQTHGDLRVLLATVVQI
ncbi:hypothetical protein LTR74_018625, partial [Friedmanniomyces endolithicus]